MKIQIQIPRGDVYENSNSNSARGRLYSNSNSARGKIQFLGGDVYK